MCSGSFTLPGIGKEALAEVPVRNQIGRRKLWQRSLVLIADIKESPQPDWLPWLRGY